MQPTSKARPPVPKETDTPESGREETAAPKPERKLSQTEAVQKARKELNLKGFVPVGGETEEGKALKKRVDELRGAAQGGA